MGKINKNFIAICLIIFLSGIVYGNTFLNEFVWDDYFFILDNPEIKSFSNVPGFFTTDVDDIYRPLRSVHYTIVYSIFKKNPFGYHLNALFFHIIISILIYFIIMEIVDFQDTENLRFSRVLKIINKRNIALISSLLFALHPIHTGRVTNMTAGFDLLGIFLFLLSFYLYILFSKEKKINYFIGSVIVFLIGLFASEEVVTLPFVILLYEFVFNKGYFLKNLKEKISKIYAPYVVLLLIYIIFRFFILGIRGRVPEYDSPGFFFTMITMAKVFVKYILLLIFPSNLKLFYDIPIANSISDFSVLLSMIILIFIVFLTIKFYNKIIFFCVFWFFITLLPFLNTIPLVVLMAERYLYLPLLGFCFLLGFIFDRIYNLDLEKKFKKNLRIMLVVFIVLLFLFYSFVIINRNAEWRDNLTFWTETVKDSPRSSRAHDNLGFTYEQMGRYKEAIIEFDKAVKLRPENYKAHTNLGVALAKIGLYNLSIQELGVALKINPYYYKAYNKLGLIYSEIEDYGAALYNLGMAVKLNPRFAKGYNDIGTVYGYIGDLNVSLIAFKTAIRLDPDYADAHYNLGVLYTFLGERGLALRELRMAVSLEPQNELYKKKLNEVI